MANDINLPAPSEERSTRETVSTPIVDRAIDMHEAMTGKRMLVGSAMVLIAALMFFFLCRWWMDHMVKRGRSPTAARRAGWSMFFFLVLVTSLLAFTWVGQLWPDWLLIGHAE